MEEKSVLDDNLRGNYINLVNILGFIVVMDGKFEWVVYIMVWIENGVSFS